MGVKIIDQLKKCSKCKKEKTLSEFYKDKRTKDGFCFQCKKCQKDYYSLFPWKRTLAYIKQRCENSKDFYYPQYGGKNIKCKITEEELKIIWFRDKAYLMKKPSIDRKDNNGNYTFKNCQYIEMSENSAKDKRKPVLQFDLNNNFIKEWKSQTTAAKTLNICLSSINDCCQGKIKTSAGFKWKRG